MKRKNTLLADFACTFTYVYDELGNCISRRMAKQPSLVFTLLLLLLVGCGNKNNKSNEDLGIQENKTLLVEEVIQQPRNKNYIGREIPVKDNPDSDFKIVIAKITDTFENSNTQGYEIRFWITPKTDITVYNSQWQTQWGGVKEGRLPEYDISNYYLFLRFVSSEKETISCDMISPYSNLSDYVSESMVNPKYYDKAVKKHPAGEWCHEEGTKISLHVDRYGLIEDLDHIEFIGRDDFSQWLNQH